MKKSSCIVSMMLVLYSCNQTDKTKYVSPKIKTTWSRDSILKYFKDSIAYRMYNGQYGERKNLNNFDSFSKYVLSDIKARNISNAFILGFDENYIDTTKIDRQRKWFRLTVDPVFRIPYCLILEQKENKTFLTLKMSDGRGGYYSGFLDFVSIQQFGDTLYSSFSTSLHKLDFWNIKDDTTCQGGTDGEGWTFEAIEDGKYNIVGRWVPLDCGNEITYRLALIGVELRKRSRFKNYLHAKTGMQTEEIDEQYPDK